ncbi:MAG TPA: hypothetical protein VLW83_09025 [Candidatus Acidoferrales bacterium]|nr:hypothetical protein [Candidatus Acidoferrales bacterium]
MQIRKAFALAAVCALILLPGASAAGGKFDGNWTTHLACEAHGQTEAYKWEFPSEIKDNNFHGVHGEPGGPGYLVIEGKINDDGSAKLSAKGTVSHNNAHGVFAMKGNNYSYNIKAQFSDTKGTGTRDEGAGILGRPCTFEFVKQTDAKPPDTNPSPNTSPSPSGGN